MDVKVIDLKQRGCGGIYHRRKHTQFVLVNVWNLDFVRIPFARSSDLTYLIIYLTGNIPLADITFVMLPK